MDIWWALLDLDLGNAQGMQESKDKLKLRIINFLKQCQVMQLVIVKARGFDDIPYTTIERYRKEAIELRNMLKGLEPNSTLSLIAGDRLTEYIEAMNMVLPSHKVYMEREDRYVYFIIEDNKSSDKYIILSITPAPLDDNTDIVFVKDWNKRNVPEPAGYSQAIDEGQNMLKRYPYIRRLEVNAACGHKILKMLKVI